MASSFAFLGIILLSVTSCCHGDLCESALGCWCYQNGEGVRAECSGEHIKHIPEDLPFNLTELLVRDSPIKILLAHNMSAYPSLQILQVKDNPDLCEIQSGALAGLPDLEKIEIVKNNISIVPSNLFSSSTSVKSIDMHENSMESLPDLPLPNLETLVVYYNRITSVHSDAFTQCTSLIRLDLSHNEIALLPDSTFAGLGNLEDLALEFNSIASISPGSFSALGKLVRLTMLQNKLLNLPDSAFSGSPSLLSLDVSKNGISTVESSAFAGLSSLEHLFLSDNYIASVPSQAFRPLLSLEILHMEGNPLHSLPTDAFGNLQKLTGLFLGETESPIEISPGAFNGLPQLNTLSVINCPKLLNLTLIELPDTLHQLSMLHLRGNGFTHLAEDTFANKASLNELYIQDNPLHCSCVLQWMAKVVDDNVVWASHWKDSGTPPRCHTPELLEEYKIPFMKETDFTCESPAIDSVSPGLQYVHLKESIQFVARLHKGLPSSEWQAPDGAKFVPLRRPPGEGKTQEILNEHRFATEAIDPDDHAMIATLYLSNASLSDAGTYHLTAENFVGNAEVSFQLEVYPYELTTAAWTLEPDPSEASVAKCGVLVLLGALVVMHL